MSLAEYKLGLSEQYQGEVVGEVALNHLLKTFNSPRQQYLLGTVLQYETETKARLRSIAIELGLDIVESDESKRAGDALAGLVEGLDWQASMQMLGEAVTPVVKRFEEILDVSPPQYKELAQWMVDHEKLIKQLFEQEAQGAGDDAVSEISGQLVFPLPSVASFS